MNERVIYNYLNEYYNYLMKDYSKAEFISICRNGNPWDKIKLGRNNLTDFIGSTINFTVYESDEDEGTDYSIPFITPQLAVGLWGTDRIGKGKEGHFDESGFTYGNHTMTLYMNGYCEESFGANDNYWNPVVDTTNFSDGVVYTYYDGKSFFVKSC